MSGWFNVFTILIALLENHESKKEMRRVERKWERERMKRPKMTKEKDFMQNYGKNTYTHTARPSPFSNNRRKLHKTLIHLIHLRFFWSSLKTYAQYLFVYIIRFGGALERFQSEKFFVLSLFLHFSLNAFSVAYLYLLFYVVIFLWRRGW